VRSRTHRFIHVRSADDSQLIPASRCEYACEICL
jgi:hypothetical protein